MRLYRASRHELFVQLEQPVLRPLPAEPYVYAEWKLARVNVDYHIELDGHYYSVPYALVDERVECWTRPSSADSALMFIQHEKMRRLVRTVNRCLGTHPGSAEASWTSA